jgi:hypothetical protein
VATQMTPEYVRGLKGVGADLVTLTRAKAIIDAISPIPGEYRGAAEDADGLTLLWAKLDIDIEACRREDRAARRAQNGGRSFTNCYPKAVTR